VNGAVPGNNGGTLKSQKRMCDQCGLNKAAAKVQLGDGQTKLLCKPCVEQEQRQNDSAAAAAAASASSQPAPKIKIGTYKEPKDDKKEKAILERDWGLDKKKDKNLSLPEKQRKLESQLADIDAAIASEKKKKDGMDQLVGFYAKDPKQQKEVIAEVADLVKVIQTATEHRATIASQLAQCQAGTDPLNSSGAAKRPGGGGASNQPLPSAGGVYRASAKKNAALGKTWGVKQLAATLTDQQKVDALYQQLDELEAAIATEVKGKQGLAVLAEQYRNSNPAQYQQISEEIIGIDDDIKRLESEANRVQGDVAVLQSPWKEANAPDGRKYYYHSETGETTWETPAELKREKRKCEQCDERARLKVTGTDGVARWYCKSHGQPGAASRLSLPPGGAGGAGGGGGGISPRPRSATAGGPPTGGPPSGGFPSPHPGGFAGPPASGGFAPPPVAAAPPAAFAPPPTAFSPPPSGGPPGGFPPMSPPNVPPSGGFSPPPAAGRPPALNRVVSQPALAVPAPQRIPGRGPPAAGPSFAPPPSGGFAPPPSGGFAAPPSGGFAPPPMPGGGGGFAPPPGGGGGFAPPPGGGGGFAPPPSGGFSNSGGFAPPPGSGGGGGGGGVVVPPGADADPLAIGYAKAHTRFVAEGTGELSLEVGDIVCVLACDGDGWWKCKLRGRKAYCPGSYLQKIPPFQ
jgi:hypothetical protein